MPSSKAPRRRGRPRASRRAPSRQPLDEILAAAGKLFSEHGFTATTTRQIARAAGLRQASLTYYFRRKDDILVALLDRLIAPSVRLIERIVDEAASPAARLYAFIRGDIAGYEYPSFEVTTVTLLPEARRPRFRKFQTQREQVVDGVRKLIREGIAQGQFPAHDVELAARTIMGMEEATGEWRSRCGGRSDAQIGEYVATAAVSALLCDPKMIERIRAEAAALE